MADQRPPTAPSCIAHALCPQVALYSSPDVDALAQGNGLDNLAQLLKPWQGSVERVTLRTSTFVAHQVPILPLLIDDARDLIRTELDAAFLDDLSIAFERKVPHWLESREPLDVGPKASPARWRDSKCSVDDLTPWYAYYRKSLLGKRLRTEYETFGHPVACIIAVSTSNPEPLNAFAALYEATSPENLFAQQPWIDRNVLRYYVLVHDLSTGPSEDYASLLEDLRRAYGVHCGFLALNSEIASRPDSAYTDASQRPPPKDSAFPAYWAEVKQEAGTTESATDSQQEAASVSANSIERGKNLGEEDVRRIKSFLREFTVQSLVPWMERVVAQSNEQLAANRKGIAGRLFTAGRRYFGSRPAASPTANGGSSAYDQIKGIYAHTAQEAQTRRLADLAFMIGDFRLAAAMYEIARKDFLNDKAWRHYASSTRMAGLSGLLLSTGGSQGTFDADAYLEQAASASAQGSTPLDELRSLCLYYELYSTSGLWSKASFGLSRCASDIEELPSAIMLEQAAVALLRLDSPARRQFALLMTVAAHRYQKTGSKLLARHCGLEALSLYPADDRRGWQLAQNHLEHTLGRSAYNLGHSEQAILHFAGLLTRAEQDLEDGSEIVDESFLDDFKLTWDLLGSRADEVAQAGGVNARDTIFDVGNCRFASNADGREPSEEARKLEEQFLLTGYGTTHASGVSRPSSLLPRSSVPTVIAGDTTDLILSARNNLNVPVTLDDVRISTSGDSACIDCQPMSKVTLLPATTTPITLSIEAKTAGSVRVNSVSCRFNGMLRYSQSLEKRGPRLNASKAEMQTPTYADDTTLQLRVLPKQPVLRVTSSNLPYEVLAGEFGRCTLRIYNDGGVPLRNLRVLCNRPEFLLFSPTGAGTIDNRIPVNTPTQIALPDDELGAGRSTDIEALYRGSSIGSTRLSCLFVFEGAADNAKEQGALWEHGLVVKPSLDFVPLINAGLATLELTVVNSAIAERVDIEHIIGLGTRWSLQSDSRAIPLRGAQAETRILAFKRDERPGLSTWKHALLQLDRPLTARDLLPDEGLVEELDLDELLRDGPLPLQLVLAAKAALRLDDLAEQFPTISRADLPAIFPLFTPDALDIVVAWQCPSTGASGFHYLADLPLGARAHVAHDLLTAADETLSKGRYEESAQARAVLLDCIARSELSLGQCPVVFKQQASANRVHLILRNIGSAAAECTIELLGIHSPLRRRTPSVRWKGRLLHRVRLPVAGVSSLNLPFVASRRSADAGSFLLHVQQGSNSWTLAGQEDIIAGD